MALNVPIKKTGDTFTADEFNLLVKDVNNKQDTVTGKGLSTNDYTDEDKSKLQSVTSFDPNAIYDALANKLSPGQVYSKEEIDTMLEEARISLNLTPEQLSGLNVNLTPMQTELEEINLWPLKGKKLLVLGDSLSASGSGPIETTSVGSWCQYTKNLLKLSSDSRVIAQGGATCTDKNTTTIKIDKADWGGDNNVLSNQVYSIIKHYKTYKDTASEFIPDIIMIMIGTNNSHTTYPDPMWSSIVGDWATCMYSQFVDTDFDLYDLTNSTQLQKYNVLRDVRKKFYAAYKWAIEALLYWFPNTSIYVLSPMANSGGRGQNVFENTVNACKEVADFLSCGYIDVHNRSGLSYYTNTRKDTGWDSQWYTFDGTHPNFDVGMELIGRYVAKELQKQYFVKPPIKSVKVPMQNTDVYYTISIVNANADTTFGTTSPNTSQQVIKGGFLTVNIQPESGYFTYSVKVDGVEQGNLSTYTFSNVQANREIIVEFAKEIDPVLDSVIINSGAASTIERNVSVKLTTTGSFTHYKMAETADLLSTPWIQISTNTISYTLSNMLGNKTIYVQVKNNVGESSVKSASIILQEKPSNIFVITAKSNNTNYGTVTPSTQNVLQGDTATVTVIARSGYIIESWSGVITSTGLGTDSGTAMVTNIQGDRIVTCNFKQKTTDSGTKTILSFPWSFGDQGIVESGITKVYLGNVNTTYTLPIGNITLNGKGGTNYSNLIGATTGNDSGIYPDKFLERGVNYSGNTSDPAVGKISISNMANGTYRIGILTNISSSAAWASYIADPSMVILSVNGAQKNPVKITNNTDTLTVFENIVVADGILNIDINISIINKRCVINAIEIEKIS